MRRTIWTLAVALLPACVVREYRQPPPVYADPQPLPPPPAPPPPAYVWCEPYYEHRGDVVVFVAGFWRPAVRVFVPPPPTVYVQVVTVRPAVAYAYARPVGPYGVFVPAPPGSHPGIIVPAPVGTSPSVVVSAPPVVRPGMVIRPTSVARVGQPSVEVFAPAGVTREGRPVSAAIPAVPQQAASLHPVVSAAPPPLRSTTPIQPGGPATSVRNGPPNGQPGGWSAGAPSPVMHGTLGAPGQAQRTTPPPMPQPQQPVPSGQAAPPAAVERSAPPPEMADHAPYQRPGPPRQAAPPPKVAGPGPSPDMGDHGQVPQRSPTAPPAQHTDRGHAEEKPRPPPPQHEKPNRHVPDDR